MLFLALSKASRSRHLAALVGPIWRLAKTMMGRATSGRSGLAPAVVMRGQRVTARNVRVGLHVYCTNPETNKRIFDARIVGYRTKDDMTDGIDLPADKRGWCSLVSESDVRKNVFYARIGFQDQYDCVVSALRRSNALMGSRLDLSATDRELLTLFKKNPDKNEFLRGMLPICLVVLYFGFQRYTEQFLLMLQCVPVPDEKLQCPEDGRCTDEDTVPVRVVGPNQLGHLHWTQEMDWTCFTELHLLTTYFAVAGLALACCFAALI